MSREDFDKYRHSLGYVLPEPSEALKKPYGVVADGIYGRYFNDLSFGTEEKEVMYKGISALLDKLAKIERDKEERFLNNYLSRVRAVDPQFATTLSGLIEKGNFSKAMTALEARRRDLLDLSKDLDKELERIAEEFSEVQNRTYKNILNNAITQGKGGFGGRNIENVPVDEILNLTFEQILERASDLFEEEISKKISESNRKTYRSTWSLFSKYIENSLGRIGLKDSKAGLTIQSTLNDYINFKKNNSKNKKIVEGKTKTGKDKRTTLHRVVEALIKDLVINGLSAELYLTERGASHTGQVTQQKISMAGKVSETQIKSDAIQFHIGDIELETILNENLKEELKKNKPDIDRVIKETLDTYDDVFVIHYSAKDLYKDSTHKEADIEKTSSFAAKLAPIKGIAHKTGYQDLDNLVFAILNLHPGLAMENEKEEVRKAIISICATWMFEDYEDTFRQVKSGVSNQHLHIYFINGEYYTVSEILSRVRAQLDESLNLTQLVSVTISTGGDIYRQVIKTGVYGISRWDAVRNKALTDGRMGIVIHTDRLKNLLIDF